MSISEKAPFERRFVSGVVSVDMAGVPSSDGWVAAGLGPAAEPESPGGAIPRG